MKIAIIGATGLVGRKMVEKLGSSFISRDAEVFLAASEKSYGKEFFLQGKTLKVSSIENVLEQKPHIALFSAGNWVSEKYAREFVRQGAFVIDNSSYWRMHDDVPLVVPEINSENITSKTRLIANPNCSTIQMVLVLSGLHKAWCIRRIVVATYQSVTGTGVRALNQLMNERTGMIVSEPAYPHTIDLNLFPHGGNFLPNGYTTEEMKLVNETRKILHDNQLQVTATVVRVPVKGGHSEAVNVEFVEDYDIDDALEILRNTPGVVVQDSPSEDIYPMPLTAEGKDEVFVGRIRHDESCRKALNLWIVADNLLKGAATNAVQIAEYIVNRKYIQ
ncbi:MAG TPA: aspartate-semialdehyde dehydrogenase [Bacteroidales bacterium]|jgi:aspartate-semialdehyde dehydrogenase|nr:aspartate-semialdehyde dehydrogenase [Bacteroidales bacterium]OQC60490.1 MAG: Aspartate-semialdehyde dehydrogenase [Bacteroidetes bacterium ADurb.Bin012]HNQ59969.1 aspartate-semialdehyde dehydrogenase [Bacteroidales bacterium]HNU21571.1 aspartate-semialdehyde dehydrogenase [Bacteroidales bacterium]HNV17140.1 aspartate-semialdehyde dehydrogenase [Bacteroidales bacterium]